MEEMVKYPPALLPQSNLGTPAAAHKLKLNHWGGGPISDLLPVPFFGPEFGTASWLYKNYKERQSSQD